MKFIIVDDEIHTDKLESILETFQEIYKTLYSETSCVNYYLEEKTELIKCTEIAGNASSVKFIDCLDDSQIMCLTKCDEIDTILSVTPMLFSIDLKDSTGQNDYIELIKNLLEKNRPIYIIAVSGNISDYENDLKPLIEKYPYFKYFKKEEILKDKEEIINGCKAIKILHETADSLKTKIEEQQKSLYKEFLENASIIATNPEAATRHMTNIVKESLYNGNLLSEKHLSFESYIPVFNKKITLQCDKDNHDKRKIDSDIRFGLILKKKDTEEYFINISPNCNINNLIPKKIESLQIMKLIPPKILKQKNDRPPEYYYPLEKFRENLSWWLDYTEIQSIKVEDFCSNFEKITLLHESVAKDIQQKFSGYYSRQGSIVFEQ